MCNEIHVSIDWALVSYSRPNEQASQPVQNRDQITCMAGLLLKGSV